MQPMKPLEAIPITHGNPTVIVKVDPLAHHVVFINSLMVDPKQIDLFVTDEANPLPAGTPVYIINGDLDQAVRIYEIFDSRLTSGSRR
jgi:hypothetical protein